MSASLADAVLALARADVNLTVHDGVVPNDPEYPYVVFYFDAGTRTPASLSGRSTTATHRFQASVCAPNPLSARIVAKRVLDQLVDARPAVAGLSCGLIRHESSPPMFPDDSLATPVIVAPLIFTVDTTLA